MSENAESSDSAIEERGPAARSGLRDRLGLYGWAILIVALLAWAAAWGARLDWRLDLASHFPAHRSIAFFVATGLLLGARSYRSAAFAGACFALQLAAFVPFWAPRDSPVADGRLYRGLTINLLASNEERDVALAYVLLTESDFVALQELTPAWSDEFEAFRKEFPHAALYPRRGAFGIGLVSRRPIVSQRRIDFGDANYPTLQARIALEQGEATVIVTHPPPPISGKNAAARDAHFAALAEHVKKIDGPVIVVGDLNVTPWSPHFGDLLEASDLRDGRLGHGVAPTWPAALGPLGIPIDHVLVTEEVDVVELQAGPAFGSDHRPVAFAFRIAAPRANE